MKLTRKKLKGLDTWHKWHEAEFNQLDMYKKQNTFGPPCELPPEEHLLNLLWTYTYKEHEQWEKTHCVCNRSPTRRGCVTLAETYASSLEQSGSRIL